MKNTQKGFIAPLLVAIIVILVIGGAYMYSNKKAEVTPISIQLKQVRDSSRVQDVSNILEAIQEFKLDHKGAFPKSITGVSISETMQSLGTGQCDLSNTRYCPLVTSCIDLSNDLSPAYLAVIPIDPTIGSGMNSHYAISKSQTGEITVTACDAEIMPISKKR